MIGDCPDCHNIVSGTGQMTDQIKMLDGMMQHLILLGFQTAAHASKLISDFEASETGACSTMLVAKTVTVKTSARTPGHGMSAHA